MINPLILGPILDLGKSLLDRFVPDPEAKRQAEADFLKMAMEGELKQTIAQLEINAKEAMSPSIWVAGWRPFFGWCGGLAFLYSTLLQPVIFWYGASHGWTSPPDINMDLLWVVITGMLGIGGLRTYEKKQGLTKGLG
jgi:hypothetical protein